MLSDMAEALRSDIRSAADRLQSKIGIGRELKTLESELWEAETVSLLASGTYTSGNGVIVLTDRRVLFYLKRLVGAQTEDFPLSKISSIDYKSGMLMGEITIYTSGQKATIKNVEKAIGKQIVDAVRNQISQPTETPKISNGDSVADQLLKLKQLHAAGALTDAQYEEKSAPLIAAL